MCMLSSASLEKLLWTEAINTTSYLINLGSHTSIKCMIPSEVWSGKSAKYSLLKVFMEYGDGVNGYMIWSPSEKQVILKENVV